VNCWRVDRAHRFYCIQDAANYFRLVREAMLRARHTVFILGWDTMANTNLLPGETPAGGPTTLAPLLRYIARRSPLLQIYLLTWDPASVYALERDPFARLRFGWRMPRNLHFAFDDRHPIGGSHHQKVVVIDDELAFAGGIDLTGHRWDTCQHRVDEPLRLNASDEPYEPYHEVQAMMDGLAAAALSTLARDRWRALGRTALPRLREPDTSLWPEHVPPDLLDVDVMISRTMPGVDDDPEVRENEALFFDSIRAAERSIYIESQYFTNGRIAEALAERLSEPGGPEVILVAPQVCHGWLEQQTVGAFRAEAFHKLALADRFNRLRLVYPAASRARNVPTFVHSKVMIVDDTFVRIGSANISNRSMAVDTECDVAVEAAGNARTRGGIRRIRDRLIAEHLHMRTHDVCREIEHAGSLRAVVDAHMHADQCLAPIDVKPPDPDVSPVLKAAADPEAPLSDAPASSGLLAMAQAAISLVAQVTPIVRKKVAKRSRRRWAEFG
jgi:phosphatidylserine/phosphatidylglycerophosphate/cardiolipin synthase-like enzyme